MDETVFLAVTLVLLLIPAFFMLAEAGMFIGYVPEGQIVFVMAGESVYKVLANVKDRYYDEADDTMKVGVQPKTYLQRTMGIYWLGFWPIHKTLSYPFKWGKLERRPRKDGEGQEKESTNEEYDFIIKDRDEIVYSLFAKFTYPIIATSISVQGLLEVKALSSIELEMIHPKKALFENLPTGQWLVNATSILLGAIRDYIGVQDVDDLRKMQNETTASKKASLGVMGSKFMNDIDLFANARLLQATGTRASSGTFLDFNITHDKNGKVLEALEEKRIAIAQGDAKIAASEKALIKAKIDAEAAAAKTVVEGEAKVKIRKQLNDAQVERLRNLSQVAAGSKDGRDIMISENQKNWRPQVIGGGVSPLIQIPLPQNEKKEEEAKKT